MTKTKFTFKIPNEVGFIQGLLILLKHKGNGKLSTLLSDAKCKIIDSGQWAQRHGGTIWDANATTVRFDIPPNKYAEVLSKISKTTLILKTEKGR